jgi:hypothetical protein
VHKRTQEAAREIAEHSGGEILAPVSDQDLAEAFQWIASVLQGAYWVEYEPLSEGEAQKKLRVETTRPHAKLLYADD